MRTRAAILATMCLGVAGCSGDAGTAASVDAAPLAVVRSAQSSIVSTAKKQRAERRARAVTRRPAVSPGATRERPTPPGPPRSRNAEPARAEPISSAPRLAAPACEQYAGALAGRMPAPVRARGEASGLAIVTGGLAAALLGMPVVAPQASLAAREELDDAHARLSRALAAREDATAITSTTRTRIQAYARALGIGDCG